LYNGITAARHKSTGPASPNFVLFVGGPQKILKDRRKRQASDPGLLDIVTPEPKTEPWYDFYLSDTVFRAKAKRSRPHYPYQPSMLQGSELDLPEALRDNPLAVFDGEHASQADIRLVHQCLKLYISEVKAAPETPAARQRYIEDKPGSKALLWSMSLSESDRHEVWSDSLSLSPVVHFLVTKKNTEAVWHWLKLDDHLGPKNYALYTSSRSPHSPQWKQLAFRDMVAAQIYWSNSADCLADAVATIHKAWSENMPIVRPATMFVYKAMKKFPIKSTKFHDQLTEIVEKIFRREDERALMSAILDLTHPTRSDTSKLIQLLRSDTPFVQQWLQPSSYAAGFSVLGITCRLARKCMAQGRRSDTKWVLDHVYDRAPYLLSGGQALRSFKSSVESTAERPRMRTPSSKELEAENMILDQDGKIVFNNEHSEYRKPLVPEPSDSTLVR